MLAAIVIAVLAQSPLEQLKYEVAQLKAENAKLKQMLYGPVQVPKPAVADNKIDNRDGKQAWRHADGRYEYMGPNGEHTGRFYDTPAVQPQAYFQPMPMSFMDGGAFCPPGGS
jgi:hypothetical protein